ncbi:hypothetical protein UCRPA7_3230 [Phaeoacremonium minimum UCRPA7]|uniref:DUF8021 domain-containing protein n=1 Tax=Phaeoacremonium minimum (strain UCR-PA7) TaxID=1286976 RepID=R8BPM6_PHAM7|nr:hypothetical protein UCRPA7_3230 [Phaeoacremonium minimum UCRPA7]EOO01250.1 hypothetical protein UCRPA7_3230 [Phaeoacremonium minimum UCRPA7]
MRSADIFSSVLGVLAVAVNVSAQCDRASLKTLADSYIAAQTAGKSSSISSLSSTVAYTENYKTASISAGILATPLKIDHNRSTFDTTACASYTELIVATGSHPYVIGTQIHAPNGSITAVDTLVTDKGDWLFNATGTLYWASREDWGPIDASKRDSRQVIQAAADAYLDYFKDKSVKVPWGTPCARLEGGSYTGKGAATDSCNVGVPNNINLTKRRYVIDEELGAVDVFLSFEDLPDSHEFRVEGGKLRFVHTLTVMG